MLATCGDASQQKTMTKGHALQWHNGVGMTIGSGRSVKHLALNRKDYQRGHGPLWPSVSPWRLPGRCGGWKTSHHRLAQRRVHQINGGSLLESWNGLVADVLAIDESMKRQQCVRGSAGSVRKQRRPPSAQASIQVDRHGLLEPV